MKPSPPRQAGARSLTRWHPGSRGLRRGGIRTHGEAYCCAGTLRTKPRREIRDTRVRPGRARCHNRLRRLVPTGKFPVAAGIRSQDFSTNMGLGQDLRLAAGEDWCPQSSWKGGKVPWLRPRIVASRSCRDCHIQVIALRSSGLWASSNGHPSMRPASRRSAAAIPPSAWESMPAAFPGERGWVRFVPGFTAGPIPE